MVDLIVIGFDDETTAEAVRTRLLQMQRDP